MQQRIIHHLTRLVPTLDELEQATRAVELEIEAQADWVQAACLHHQAETDEVITAAEAAFDAFLSENQDSRRRDLSSHRSAQVIMEIGREKERRYPSASVATRLPVVGDADQANGAPRADGGHEPGATAMEGRTDPWWLRWLRAALRLVGRQPPQPPSG
jgi:hypothetical protein